jgi:hypothetical protein
MPLSTQKEVLETSNGLVNTLRAMAGDAPHSFRPGAFAQLLSHGTPSNANILGLAKEQLSQVKNTLRLSSLSVNSNQ